MAALDALALFPLDASARQTYITCVPTPREHLGQPLKGPRYN